jgi:hypothetical protein
VGEARMKSQAHWQMDVLDPWRRYRLLFSEQ